MACIKGASRSALVAFAPEAPYMAAGTLAGAVDLSFSSSANLEIFNLDFVSEGQDLPLAGSCPSSERFNRLSWGKAGSLSEEYSLGLVAGGLGDGSISVWNPLKLISSDDVDGAFVARLEKHTGAVRGLEFCVLSPNLLASGADEGELCVWDMEKPVEPTLYPSLKNPGSGSQGEISFVSWNPKFQQILASTSYNGMAVVWDLRKQKPLTSFSDTMKRRCSVLQWNPDISTQLIVASDDDSSPSLKLWDVRKTISPLKEFVGHTKGVIAMSWCPTDSSLLLTCAKDNRTICWDTVTGEVITELPASTNWNFDIHWYPKIPGVISASSFDGKIGIYNIEACNRLGAGEGDFGSQASLRAPKWLKRPVGVSFGFGGKVVSFQPSASASGAPSSEVYVHNLITEQNLVSRSTEFEAAIHDGERSSLKVLCEKKSQESELEDDREAWGYLKVMFEDEGTARSKLLSHLGFSVPNTGDGSASDELGMEFSNSLRLDDNTESTVELIGKGELSPFSIDNGEEFFNNIQPSGSPTVGGTDTVNGEQAQQEQLEPTESSDSSIDEIIQRALVVGDYKGAVSQCLSVNRIADALVIAHASGPDLWRSTRDQYLKKSHIPYLKVVSALVNNDLSALVSTRPLSSWKETLALLCTFAQKEEWTVLCDTLASRLMGVGNTLAATLCYICAGNIDKTVEIWSRSLKSGHEGRSYVDQLQDLMEKTIVLALATGQKQFSAAMSKLVENYAELLASQGLLTTAMDYLKLLGLETSSHELSILRDRVLLSTQEKDISKSLQPEATLFQGQSVYGEQPSFDQVTSTLHYQDYTQQQQQQQHQHQQPSIVGGSHGDGYLQPAGPYGAYQQIPSNNQFPDYTNAAPFQPAPAPNIFFPTQMPRGPELSSAPPAAIPQPTLSTFVPATPAALRNVERYQPPTLASQLYPGTTTPTYQSVPAQGSLGTGLSQVPSGLSQAPTAQNMFPHQVASTQTNRGFSPVTNPGFVPSSGLGPVQPSTPSESAQIQPVNAPPAPPPTVQTVDTSNVTAELKPVIITLTRLYNETSDALGGLRANPAKRREIDDNSRKIGSLFAKLNNQDISPNASSKLIQLCKALDSGDYAGALHIQVILTTSDWDECNFWLAALKRMIKIRQNMRPQ